MPLTTVRSRQIRDQEVYREDLNTTTPGKAVVVKIIAGTGITLTSTGADPGTGDVTISVDSSTVQVDVIDGGTVV